jgi:hypothetical protein
MARGSRLFVVGALILAGGLLPSAVVADDDDEDTYDVDFYNYAGDSGTVYLDGISVCTLQMKESCSKTIQKTSGHHTAVFQATAGYKVSDAFDASTCGQYPGASVNFDIYDDRVEISCNGLSF